MYIWHLCWGDKIIQTSTKETKTNYLPQYFKHVPNNQGSKTNITNNEQKLVTLEASSCIIIVYGVTWKICMWGLKRERGQIGLVYPHQVEFHTEPHKKKRQKSLYGPRHVST